METSKIVCIAAILLILVLTVKCKNRENFRMAPSTASFIPDYNLKGGAGVGGLHSGMIRGDMSLSGVDFGSMTKEDDPAHVNQAKAGEYVTAQDMLPDGTMGTIRPDDFMDTRQVSVQLKSRKWEGNNFWVINPIIEPVNSIHAYFDVDPLFDRPNSAYDSHDPELAATLGLVKI